MGDVDYSIIVGRSISNRDNLVIDLIIEDKCIAGSRVPLFMALPFRAVLDAALLQRPRS